MVMPMDIAEIEKKLIDIDAEIHRILQHVSRSKKLDVKAELDDYNNLKRHISKNIRRPLDPTAEIREMREKQYTV
jgi:t-SNARE complex subunit (syntaxin)